MENTCSFKIDGFGHSHFYHHKLNTSIFEIHIVVSNIIWYKNIDIFLTFSNHCTHFDEHCVFDLVNQIETLAHALIVNIQAMNEFLIQLTKLES